VGHRALLALREGTGKTAAGYRVSPSRMDARKVIALLLIAAVNFAVLIE
jgi:hypothetical protein